ncbi:M20 family metallopeptidase [Granulicella sp. WH15]|uniref:peptidase dimerization domain-containing protein n=1 Tax=Granulicella sp. WH15 TaxID=2602070 RepID=UPI001366FEC7|nr:peptidase dimerization domain-containing protein [Granulicella sp. WH15]QHN04842.1 M20 family metallopeptidase [Granulicella sp. WH15]
MKSIRFARAACLATFVLACSSALAQETPTEVLAAKKVLADRAELEKSLNLPTLVKQVTAPNPARDKVVARAKELMDTELIAMGDDITRHPEIGFKETRTVKIETEWLARHGFKITMPVAGLDTAFTARFDGPVKGPVMGVVLEYDALRGTDGPFHGDQHSTQGPIGMAVAVAMAEYLTASKTPGSIVAYGTPAEEMMPVVKTIMYKAGVFDGADVVVRSHAVGATTRSAPGFGTCCLNIDGVHYIYSGAPAHQMTSWAGRNALEAVIHLFENVDSMRSTIRPEARIQGVITEGGTAPNVVPDRAVANFYIRYPDAVYLAQVREMMDNAAKAAALSTGTKLKIVDDGSDRDGISIATLDEVAFTYEKKYGGTNVQEEPAKPAGWEETGSVSTQIPGVGFAVQTSTYPNHTYEMLKDTTEEIGHHGFIVDAQAMTALLFDFATQPAYREIVKKEFKAIQDEFAAYTDALKKAYPLPNVPDPK